MANISHEVENQLGLALAALGIAIVSALEEEQVSPTVIESLRRRSDHMHRHLQHIGADQAASIFAPFARALRDGVLTKN